MLDLKIIRENPDLIKKACLQRGVKIDIDKILELDTKRRKLQKEVDELRSEQNKVKDNSQISQMKQIKEKIKKLEIEAKSVGHNLNSLVSELPNLPLDDVPEGKNENDNKVIKEAGEKPKFDFQPADYLSLAEELDLIDVERAGKVSGSRFGYLKNEAAMLEFAIMKYALDMLLEEGFVFMVPPVMIKPEMMLATGYSSYTEGQEAYYLEKDKLFLAGTGEHALITYHADEILSASGRKPLPLRYVAFSTCFRREAGSYGKDTKGIFRVHQFDKLEMVSFTRAEQSKKEFEFLLSMQERLVQGLKLPYHLLAVCANDLPKPSAKVIDLECWIPSESKYRETHSVSNCTDFQARRLNIRYKENGQNHFAHTLNGTAFAMPRIIIAIIENYQTIDGTIKVPEVLRKYLNFEEIKEGSA
ncbi:MAG: serine--tRNA ligase [bacterium]